MDEDFLEKFYKLEEKIDDLSSFITNIKSSIKLADKDYLESVIDILENIEATSHKQNEILLDTGKQLANMIIEHKSAVSISRSELAMNTKRNKKRKAIAKAIQDYYEN